MLCVKKNFLFKVLEAYIIIGVRYLLKLNEIVSIPQAV